MWEQTKQIFLKSMERVVHAVARFLPGLLGLLLVLAASAIAAVLLRIGVRRICERVDLDRRLREWGVAAPAAEGRHGPSLLIARFVTWTVPALGFLAGLSVFEDSTTSALAVRLLEYVPNVLVGLAIVVAGLAGARVIERNVLIGAVNMGLQSARFLGLGVRWLVVVLAIAMALDQLGVGGTILAVSFGILFGGIVLALALAVGLGAKDAIAHSLERRFRGAPEKDEGGEEDDFRHL